MKFLFMDENYADPRTPAPATILTAILISEERYAGIRREFLDLVNIAIGAEPNAIPPMPIVHASNLFPDLRGGDGTRLAFLEGIVRIVLNHAMIIHRVGYLKTAAMQAAFGSEVQILGLCFQGILWSIEDDLKSDSIWPIMETDRSNEQDRAFALHIRNISYDSSRLPPGSMSIDDSNLGELLYATKASAMGSIVDCVAYLRQAVYLKSTGATLTPFKAQLADIGQRLAPAIATEEVIQMTFGPPPPAYIAKGPARYAYPLKPSSE